MNPFTFILFCLAWFVVLAWRLHTHLSRRAATFALAGLGLWLLYAATLAYRGVLLSPAPPPRVLLVGLPMLAFLVWLARSPRPLALVERVSLRELVGLQAFRIGVELFLVDLWRAGSLPKGMTWHGHNFDVVTGVSALILFVLWRRIPRVESLAWGWNLGGLLLVAQVAVTGILSAPGPQQLMNRDTPNLAIVSFPHVLVAALFVLSAVSLHVLAFRKLARAPRP